MIVVGIYIKDSVTLEYNRVELFDEEKISVVSSIQNINDISKTYTDFSQTFTVPASKQNNKIFRHWYDNSNDSPFSTLVKSDAYIEIDTIPFRSGKIQLESANVKDGQAQDYSITFIGILGNLKDTFAGLFLKDIPFSDYYVYSYNATSVKNKVVSTTTSDFIMFPLITSNNLWKYGSGYDISVTGTPIRYSDLFPSMNLKYVLDAIGFKFNINFNGLFLSDARFINAYLWMKNADTFEFKSNLLIDFATQTIPSGSPSYGKANPHSSFNFSTETLKLKFADTYGPGTIIINFSIQFTVVGLPYNLLIYKNGILINTISKTTTTSISTYTILDNSASIYDLAFEGNYTFKIESSQSVTFSNSKLLVLFYEEYDGGVDVYQTNYNQIVSQTTSDYLNFESYMPEIKIEDFFSGLLKMFNLTCYSSDGINYTVEQLENYYLAGSDVDITKYVIQDKKALNRVKTYKKINFDYEKSDSFVNVAFNSNAGIEYGSLRYVNNPITEGEEYSVKLPFEDLNFQNIGGGLLQVGYALKTDYQKYIPKPVILYDYNSTALTTIPQFYFNTNISGGTSTPHTVYKAFGQETLISGQTYGLNFNQQQSTITNDLVEKGLYNQYYENYFINIFNVKARLVKVSAILPTSIITSLKLNDNIIIRDTKYLINTFTTDLTTGEVQFELLTDFRTL